MNHAHTEQDVELSLAQYVEIVSRRRWIVVIISVLVFAAAAAYAFLWPPVFRATTVLSIEKESGNSVQSQIIGDTQDEEYFETQFKLIASETALRRVYADLN